MIDSSFDKAKGNVMLSKELLSYMVDVIEEDKLLLHIIKELAYRDKLIAKRVDGLQDCIFGTTKKELCESIVTGSKINKKTKEKEDTYLSIKVMDKYMGFLSGATLVCYKKNMNKVKRYMFTKRGWQVLDELQKRKYFSIDDICKNHKLK